MESRLKLLKSLLKIGSHGVLMVGIWGIGGGGKTTLAQCVYDEISHVFSGHCFVDNIREVSSSINGLKTLQQMVLKSFLKKEVEVESVEDGKQKIKQRLCHSNVLIVLDDVDHIDQLRALAGSCDWFGDGSRVIITTRDEHLLRAHKIIKVSEISLLSLYEAIELFRRYAYREEEPVEDYEKLSLEVVSYANRLPLALKVLGCFLYDKDKKGWLSTLDSLERNPNMEIVQKLKISYDGLEPLCQELFLDIACFFRGRKIDETKEMLEACEFHPDIGIRVLIHKAVITISKDYYGNEIFDMPDLVQEMGHYTVQGAHRDSPEKHSRLWQTEVIDDLCLRDEIKVLRLKTLKLNGLTSLLNIPDIHWLPRLEVLSILKCHGLEDIHPSLGNHNSLVELHIEECDELKILPYL